MADDSLIEETAPKVPAAEYATRADLAQMAGSLKELATQVTSGFTALRQSQPKPEPVPEETGDSFLDSLVKDGQGAVDGRIDARLRETLGPYLQSQLITQAETNVDSARSQIDKTYGEGTYNEIVAPKVEAILSQMDDSTRAIARGSKQTFDAILKQARGDDAVMEALLERRDKMRREPPELLGNSRERPNTKATLTPEDLAWLEDYERAGRNVDRKALTELLDHRKKHGSWNIQNLGGRNKLNLER